MSNFLRLKGVSRYPIPQLQVGEKHWYFLNNPFKPEFTIVIFIHYKPRIAVTILDL